MDDDNDDDISWNQTYIVYVCVFHIITIWLKKINRKQPQSKQTNDIFLSTRWWWWLRFEIDYYYYYVWNEIWIVVGLSIQ